MPASATFALAPGNTNPQGIADPPTDAAFNDPDYKTVQWEWNNVGQTGGIYDVDIDAPEAWQVTTGSTKTVLAEIDSGVDFTDPDVYLNIWLNQGEIPAAVRTSLAEADADAIATFRDLNAAANAGLVTDLNSTGYIDGGDLLLDPRWSDGIDDDGNGKIDDLVGWDFLEGDNDPRSVPPEGHGTGMAKKIGAIPNNGIGMVGINHSISIMAVRFWDRIAALDYTKMAAGLDYAVAEGAPISALYGGNYEFSQVMYDSIQRAQLAGHLVVAPAGNDTKDNDVTPRYPASFDLDNIISATAFNSSDQFGPMLNWGATTVDLAGPGTATSSGAAHVAGVAALLKTAHPDWNYAQLKDRILSTADPSSAFAGKTVTGGRLNAANALGVVQVVPPTKFYVVNDATFDRIYEYAAAGDVTMSYNTHSANTAPRGAASTAAGTRVWIIDANKSVYVYDPEGTRLGSWTAGGLNGAAQVEGIATNGTDVWIVDAKSDKVYRYAGAANRLSDSQNAASSFSLNKSNVNPKDIVTDGTSIWIVDNSASIDKVFKYTLSGSLVGSWTINTSGATSPTGITLDPAAPSDIWIVDNGADRVYQYTAAVSKTSGSLSATASFPLAPGNTNPQGIADPPTGAETVELRTVADAIPLSSNSNSRLLTPKPRPRFAAGSQVRSTEDLTLLVHRHRAAAVEVLVQNVTDRFATVNDAAVTDAAFGAMDDAKWPMLAPEMLTI